jgi:type IV fimbrial biogenesis protein FimT
MIVLAVMGILVSFALPSLSELIYSQRVKTATSDVFATLIYARSEAIKRASNVTIAPNSASDWSAGWRVTVTEAGSEVPLRVQDAISGVNITISGDPASIVYRRDGRLTAAVAPFVLNSTQSVKATARCIRLDPSGRPNIQADTDNNPANGCQ